MIYFKRVFFGLMLLAFAGICFASCVDQKYMQPDVPGEPTADAGPVVIVPNPNLRNVLIPQTVKEDNVEFTLPSNDWVSTTNGVPEDIKAYVNPAKRSFVLFAKDLFNGTFEQYAVLTIKNLQDAGGHLVAAKVAVINGLQLLQVEGTGNNSRIFTWSGTARGNGYLLTCTGSMEDNDLKEICQSVGNSFKIHFETQ